MDIEAIYKQTKIKIAHYINTSVDTHIKLVKSFQKKKEDKNLKSVFKDAKRYADELQLSCHFNEEATVITHDDQVTVVSTKEPRSIKEILKKTTQQKRRTEVMQQPWLGKYVSQRWKDVETTSLSYQVFKSWKSIPDIVLSVDTSIRQQLMNTKVYRKNKSQESVDETNCRLCSNDQETVSRNSTPYTMWLLQNSTDAVQGQARSNATTSVPQYIEKLEFSESQLSLPWHKQSHPVPCLENEKAKVMWDIPWHLEKRPRNGANKPDISVPDKVKKEKHADLRIGVKSLYSGHKVSSIEVIFDFLAAYSTHLEKELTKILQDKRIIWKTKEKSQKWIISQNCEIVKRFAWFF